MDDEGGLRHDKANDEEDEDPVVPYTEGRYADSYGDSGARCGAGRSGSATVRPDAFVGHIWDEVAR